MTDPKVSCLMVTSCAPGRREFLTRTLQSYCRQTYANRELIVVPDAPMEEREALARALDGLGRPDIFVDTLAEGGSLGALRNRSLERATGDIVCQWDDDDLFHPQRIEAQAAPLLEGRAEASVLGEHFSYFQEERRMAVLDWSRAPIKGHPGTLMMRRTLDVRYPAEGPFSKRSEDSSVFHQLLRRRVPVAVVGQAPHLLVYRFHGGNTWAREHHEELMTRCGRPRAALLADEERLVAGLRDVFLEEDAVHVEGPDGPAFARALREAPPGGGAP